MEHALYSEDDAAQLLGTYSNQRSASSAAPAGELDSTEVLYLPTAQGLLPIAAQINGRLYAIHTDHLNTPRRLTNAQGQVAWQWLLSGFGEVNPTTGANGYVQQESAAAGSLESYAPEVSFNLRYPGQQWDEETGLAFNMNRYYHPQEGRYIQADPIGLDGGWNRFAYVGGDPLSSMDPLGLLTLPNDPSGLPPGWAPDPSHRDPNGERFRDPNGDILDWHKGRPGLPGWRGKDHWHHNGGDEHLPPGTEVPDSCPPERSIFDRLKDYLTPPPVYDPRTDRWIPAPSRPPWFMPTPGRRGPIFVP